MAFQGIASDRAVIASTSPEPWGLVENIWMGSCGIWAASNAARNDPELCLKSVKRIDVWVPVLILFSLVGWKLGYVTSL